MADQIAGLGRFSSGPSGYGQSYVERIRKGGEAVSKSITDTGATITGILEKERAAKAMVKDADFSNDPAMRSIFGMQAEELKAKIGGRGEDAYDFSKESEILRFNNDVKKFNDSLAAAEEVYQGAVTGLQELEDQHNLLMKTGGDVKQAPTQEIQGVEVYNDKITAERFEDTIIEADLLRNANVSKSLIDGEEKFVARDQGGKVVGVFDSPEQLLERMVGLAKPDFQPVPVPTGREIVIDRGYGTLYDTESNAESAFVNYVLNEPEIAKRRMQEKYKLPAGSYNPQPSEKGAELIKRHPNNSRGFEEMNEAQYELVQEMLQEWRDERRKIKEKEKPKTGSSATVDNLIGRIDNINYTLNADSQVASETGMGVGVSVSGKIKSGLEDEGNLQQLRYEPGSGEFVAIVRRSNEVDGLAEYEMSVPLGGSDPDGSRAQIAGAMRIDITDLQRLMREMQSKGLR